LLKSCHAAARRGVHDPCGTDCLQVRRRQVMASALHGNNNCCFCPSWAKTIHQNLQLTTSCTAVACRLRSSFARFGGSHGRTVTPLYSTAKACVLSQRSWLRTLENRFSSPTWFRYSRACCRSVDVDHRVILLRCSLADGRDCTMKHPLLHVCMSIGSRG